jgi:2-isopropylmalate synthase
MHCLRINCAVKNDIDVAAQAFNMPKDHEFTELELRFSYFHKLNTTKDIFNEPKRPFLTPNRTEDVEFYAEDAGRTDNEF